MSASEQPHILLIEDTASLARMYESGLEQEDYKVSSFETATEGLEALKKGRHDLVLLDLRLPDMDGITVLKKINDEHKKLPIIVITGHGSVNIAVEAMRYGASDFLVKPFNLERLINAVDSELNKDPNQASPSMLAGLAGNTNAHTESAPYTDSNTNRDSGGRSFGGFIGTSPIMVKLYEQIESAAKSDATAFIAGESGTGKEVCAEAIHKYSPRSNKPFIPINCAAIPRDLMESELFGHVKGAFTGAVANRDGAVKMADGGTLFLDEIAEMHPDMQTKLLRFLQNLTFQKIGGSSIEKANVRIICATNRNPMEEVKAGRFREDLFYRLHVLPVYMPPLRNRGEDVIDIAQALLRRYTEEENKRFQKMSPEVENIFRSHPWPGNIRQLQNIVRQSIVMHDGDVLMANMLPHEITSGSAPLHQADTYRIPTPQSVSVAAEQGNVSTAPYNAQNTIMGSGTNNVPLRQEELLPLARAEREYIEQAINACLGNIPKAAAMLEISPSTIYRKKIVWDSDDEKERQLETGNIDIPV